MSARPPDFPATCDVPVACAQRDCGLVFGQVWSSRPAARAAPPSQAQTPIESKGVTMKDV